MKLIYAHRNFAQAGLVRAMLQEARIPCMTRNEHLTSLLGELPALDIELWVADEDYFLAQSVVSQMQDAPETEHEAWTCPRCGELNEGNMGACWNCDWEIDGLQEQ